MELIKYEIEVLEYYTVAQLLKTSDDLNIILKNSRVLKNHYMDMRDTNKAVKEEKTILMVCENLNSIESVLLMKEGDTIEFTNFGQHYLN